ncbi:hypothetical protein GCM10027043_44040 [Ferruginibacter profundus]
MGLIIELTLRIEQKYQNISQLFFRAGVINCSLYQLVQTADATTRPGAALAAGATKLAKPEVCCGYYINAGELGY